MYQNLGTSTAVAGAALAGGVLATMYLVCLLISLAVYVLIIIAEWKIFTKAGEKGWKSLIPFYNLYIVFKLFWETKWFWITIGVTFGASLLASCMASIDGAAGFVSLLTFGGSVFSIIVSIMLTHRMSKSFGHGAGFTCGLIFLPVIFTLILGFNKDKYKKVKA
ncbi:hypothetical protein IJF86_00840 [Candidatus Saccharibacteria bacterium]|nr:hypothetical protein [Candidatus Saccharibacteria bacterium]